MFITTSTIDIIEERLRKRGSETEESLKTRLRDSQKWMDKIQNQYAEGTCSIKEILINDDYDETEYELLKIIDKFYPNLKE